METRTCTACGHEKDISEFAFKYKARGIRQSRCRACQSQASKQHYKNNKQPYIDRARARETLVIEGNRRNLVEYLNCHPCVDCGNSDIRVLEFDHVRGKKSGNIGTMLALSFSWDTIEAEIAKCEVRCGNCHRIKTIERAKQWRAQ